jgi:hypothetical protein
LKGVVADLDALAASPPAAPPSPPRAPQPAQAVGGGSE